MASITIIGAGKAATSLGLALRNAGHIIPKVWSRTKENAEILAQQTQSVPITDLRVITSLADFYLIAVSDDAIPEMATKLSLPAKIAVHCSGMSPISLLSKVSPRHGVLYPLVSMTKEGGVDFKKVMILVEGSDQATTEALVAFASTISDHVKVMNQAQRQAMHLSAVFAHNFTNHLYNISSKLMEEHGMQFADLYPLITSHLQSLAQWPPASLQTGPAIRKDTTTIERHLELLRTQPEYRELYVILTRSIQGTMRY